MLLPHRALALGGAATHLRLVHHVVVVQRRQVHQLDDRARDGDLPRVGFGPELRGQHREQRAEPLAAGLEQVLDRLGHQLVGLAQLGGHQLLDARHSVANILRRSAASPKSTPATTVAGVLIAPTYWEAMDTQTPTWWSIGAGPAGSAAAAWAARAGRDVLVIDSAQFPRDKACGDGLTPRAVAELRAARPRPVARRPDRATAGCGCRASAPTSRSSGRARRSRRPAARCRAPNSTTASASVAADDGAKMLLGAKAVDVQHDSIGPGGDGDARTPAPRSAARS